MIAENKLGTLNVKKLIWSMGVPMIFSMVLQALYNVVDTVFVINMGEGGSVGNLALSAAFPIQILIIAIGVGSGVGLNALLSENLGKKDAETASKVVGNGLFLAAAFYVIFLLFGLFLAKPYMTLMSADERVIETGTEYLKICCCISLGSVGFAFAGRFLIASGKTILSTLSQISGAATNIILDYVFIYPLNGGIAGAAYATVIGQIVSLVMALALHYSLNREIKNGVKYLCPDGKIIAGIYKIGLPAFLMQAMLSVMMFGVLLIIGTVGNSYTVNLLTGSFGIYYKLMQIALFAAFGLSNTLITVTSYNVGTGDKDRILQTAKHGIAATVVVTAVITIIYQAFAVPVSKLFALTSEQSAVVSGEDVINTCAIALHIATIGYVFMGISVAVQGVLQGFRSVWAPLIISALRLIVLVLPLCYVLTLSADVTHNLWWAFPVAEVVTASVSLLYLKSAIKNLDNIRSNRIATC